MHSIVVYPPGGLGRDHPVRPAELNETVSVDAIVRRETGRRQAVKVSLS